MDPPTSPPSTKKRSATSPAPPPISTPRILHRHHHRRPTPAQPPFNIYKSILRHPHLFFPFTLRLPYTTLTALYSIDKEFHYRVNKFSVSLIHDYATHHAPQAARIFTWSLYPQLCLSDPQLRPMDARTWLARDVPGFRWLGLVLARQRTVRRILTLLALAGHRVPRAAEPVLMKYWVLMETRTSAARRAFLLAERIWSDADVALFSLVQMKLDMAFTDPVRGNGVVGLSRLLLSQASLRPLEEVLASLVAVPIPSHTSDSATPRKMTYDDLLSVLLRTYLPTDLDLATHPWLADASAHEVPAAEIGLLSREGWAPGGARLESAVDMVLVEGVRRGLHVQRFLLDFLLYGTVERGGGNVGIPRVGRGEKGVVVVRGEGRPGEAVREGVLGVLEERVGKGVEMVGCFAEGEAHV